ncbi:uncharacterized protein N7482_001077 [Penicillium canariense]|uniref:Uncharacterized protein n=1 Tax=Penicillium canariense TaxID=189055 RepID=A0A9W9IDE6_9EURO|nr:uncharacterized protein N7482_001077 [Penicillium canariense]KAJ5175200.1 hypothetical protein N7482_001077 [Penicillium canariense]
MAGIVNKPLAIFRRPESPKPLHTRWGDVAISVPTDGSWNQYDNPHRPAPERQSYGPGFVPDYSPSDRVYNTARSSATRESILKSEDSEDDNKSTSTGRASTVSISRRNSLSLGAFRPHRLSVRLASRPKPLRGELQLERESHQAENKMPEFAYKPIHQNYPTEISEKSERSTHHYRYIPTNGRYLEDIPSPRSPRSQSATPFHGSRTRRDSFIESLANRERGRELARVHSPQNSRPEDDCQSVRSSLADSSDSSSAGSGSRLSFGLPPRRRSLSLKPLTLAMVPDPEDLYA